MDDLHDAVSTVDRFFIAGILPATIPDLAVIHTVITELVEIFPARDQTVGSNVARISQNEIESVVMKSCRRSRDCG